MLIGSTGLPRAELPTAILASAIATREVATKAHPHSRHSSGESPLQDGIAVLHSSVLRGSEYLNTELS